MSRNFFRIIFIFLFLLTGLIWGAVFQFPDNKLHLVFCDVGQGDAILITKGKNQILVDGGPNEKVLICLSKHLPFWDRQIELVILTHPEFDHLTGLVSVIERYKILQIISNSLIAESGVFQKFREEVVKRAIPVYSPHQGERIKIGEINLEILFPEERLGEEIIWQTKDWSAKENLVSNSSVLGTTFVSFKGNLNETSIVSLLEFGDFQALLTGDIGIKEEKKIISFYQFNPREIEVLKIPHHGSKYSSSEEFLKTINPKIAIISVGANNRWGHPTAEVLERLKSLGIEVYRTDLEGEIEIVSDGKKWYLVN
ncbi:MAG: ComEC/Rec2 family competence protein [Microgenomates group bacterium]